jgi:hypothetical protein
LRSILSHRNKSFKRDKMLRKLSLTADYKKQKARCNCSGLFAFGYLSGASAKR